jgi:parallel beta-helix repeat protein
MKLKYLPVFLSLLLVSCKEQKPEEIPYEIHQIVKSGTVIDCKGEQFNDGKLTEIRVRSSLEKKVENVTIKNCKLYGSIRLFGLGMNGESKGVNESSKSKGHTERAQKAAPSNVLISNMEIKGEQRIPIYLSPGTNRVTIENSTITGTSNSVAIYMDAESGYNVIRNNVFDVKPVFNMREVIAVDGSANNLIVDNTFKQTTRGGIYLYRNCGEGGTVRHQSPQQNLIEKNTFNLQGLNRGHWGIWIGSRNGNRNYCEHDAGYPFGSSVDNGDFANNNTIQNNKFSGSDNTIRDDGKNNVIK